jgi:hypothetical protein
MKSLRLLTLCSLAALLFASTLFADDVPYSISPTSGPALGRTPVTVKGNFGTWPYGLIFGGVSVTATRIDEHTLVAFAPAHPPGTVDVTIFEYDFGILTGLKFTYNDVGTTFQFERVLLPIYTPPARGLFGSEFHSELRAMVPAPGGPISLFGVDYPFNSGHDPVVTLQSGGEATLSRSADDFNGNPGRFVFVDRDEYDLLGLHLRAFDVSRNAQTFGTEIPIVHEREFSQAYISFPGVPIDSRFRTTLRIYAAAPTTVRVKVGTQSFDITLQPGRNLYEPAFASFSDFPIGSGGSTNVTVEPPIIGYSPIQWGPPVWAFLTITNNDTQQITTMSPHR